MRRKNRKVTLVDWMRECEAAIARNTTPPRTRGKYKGHGSTNTKWIVEVTSDIVSHVLRTTAKDRDENMAAASYLAFVFGQWYLHVHRAKCYDENRPLALRRRALRRRNKWLEEFLGCAISDRIMSKVWTGQKFSPPFGKGARGGKFI